MKFINLSILILLISQQVLSQTVCSEDELIREIREDIADNGKLDCLRVGLIPDESTENQKQRTERLAAQWDSDCAFESEDENGNNTWMEILTANYGIEQLVDVEGAPVQGDYADQADMCEIVRAAIAAGKVQSVGPNVQNIPVDVVDEFECVGDEGQTQVCAATSGSFAYKPGWFILLEGSAIAFNGVPKFVLAPDE